MLAKRVQLNTLGAERKLGHDGGEDPVGDAPASIVFELGVVIGQNLIRLATWLPGHREEDVGVADEAPQVGDERQHRGFASHAHDGIVRRLAIRNVSDGATFETGA